MRRVPSSFLRVVVLCGVGGCFFLGSGSSSNSSSAGCNGANIGGSDATPCEPSDAASVDAHPPPRPSTHRDGGATRWFALRALRLGTETPDGRADTCAWTSIGFDLDDRVTTRDDSPTSNDSCQRVAGSPSEVLTDGDDGIDNSFGAHVMAEFRALNSFGGEADDAAPRSLDAQVDAGFARGFETLLLRVDNVFDDDEANAPGALYVTTPLGRSPVDMDVWPVSSASLLDGHDLALPRVVFPRGYIAHGVWVSGIATSRVALPTFFAGNEDEEVRWPIDDARLAIRLDDGAGTLGGAMEVGAMRDALTPLVEHFGVCAGNPTFDQVVLVLTTQSADLVVGAPELQDTTRTCDAVSIGVGVQLAPAAQPTTVADPPPPPKDPCSDAGP